MTAPYVTTSCTTTGELRTSVTTPSKVAVGVGVHGERRALLRRDLADVGLVDRRDDAHLAEVGGDREEHGRLEDGRDGLPGVDVARDDDAVDGRVR